MQQGFTDWSEMVRNFLCFCGPGPIGSGPWIPNGEFHRGAQLTVDYSQLERHWNVPLSDGIISLTQIEGQWCSFNLRNISLR